MALTASVFLAYVLNLFSVFVFRNPEKFCISQFSPFVSSLVFTTTIYLFLLDTKIYPARFRSINVYIRLFIETLIAVFFIETTMCDFWFPLEGFVLNRLPILSGLLKRHTPAHGPLKKASERIVKILTGPIPACMLSYVLSIFFLVVVMHGSRTVDFRLLRCGPGLFAKDCVKKMKRGLKRIIRPFRKLKVAADSKKKKMCPCPCKGSLKAY